MSKNMGTIDRVLRLALAGVLLVLAFGTGIAASGVLHWLAIAVAAIFALTAAVGTCPLYSLVGVKTCRTS